LLVTFLCIIFIEPLRVPFVAFCLGTGSQVGIVIGGVINGITANPFYITYIQPYVAPIFFVCGIIGTLLFQRAWPTKIKPHVPFINKTTVTPDYQNQPVSQPPQVIPQQPTPQPVPIVVEQPKKEVEK